MSKSAASENSIRSLIIILVGVTVVFVLLACGLFRLFPWPATAADFGQAISGLSALFTALAFAGALYAVVLQRIALQLQQQQMTKEIGEVREQTNLLADRLQQIAPIYRAYDRLDATVELTEAILERAKKSIDEAIMYFPESDKKTDLIHSLATFFFMPEVRVKPLGAEHKERVYRTLERDVKMMKDIWLAIAFNSVVEWGWEDGTYWVLCQRGSWLAEFPGAAEKFQIFLYAFSKEYDVPVKLGLLDPSRHGTYNAW